MDQILEKWDEILMTVKTEHDISDIAFNTFLRPLEFYGVTGNTAYILVPSEQLGLSYISKKYYLPLKVAITEITGTEYEIKFILPEQAKSIASSPNKQKKPFYSEAASKSNLNSNYTFDTFVVGSNNRFAHSASLAVAESPGEIYNPLFIYGGVGLGKTHLMHSIAHFILKNNPEAKILYVTSEKFTNELIDAIRNKNNISTTEFREKYRNNDVLLIDDIQFIIGKESTQEEFFHTFNTLYEAKKQIIISSDKPPKEIATLEGRLKSRFEWGLIADISSPDYETRMAILRKKEERDSKEKGYHLDDEVNQYIATNIKSNIRELEGALNRITAMSSLEHREITVELAQEALKDMISPNAKREITPDLILLTVAEHFHIKTDDIKGSKRSADIVIPRQIAMYLCREMTSTPLKAIGKLMGNRDHTTVLHGVEKISKEIETSDDLKNTIDIIKKKLNPN